MAYSLVSNRYRERLALKGEMLFIRFMYYGPQFEFKRGNIIYKFYVIVVHGLKLKGEILFN